MDRTKKIRSCGKPYSTWSEEEKTSLVRLRIQMDSHFTSKNANMNDGWRLVAQRYGDPRRDYKSCRQVWKNVCQKYKILTAQRTGDGAGDDAPSKWEEIEESPMFQLFKSYAEQKHNYHPPLVLESSVGAVSMSAPSVICDEAYNSPSPSSSSSSKSHRSTTTLSAYEQYCVKRDKKLSKQMGSLMAVFGQMVAKEYPDVNVDQLLIASSSDDD